LRIPPTKHDDLFDSFDLKGVVLARRAREQQFEEFKTSLANWKQNNNNNSNHHQTTHYHFIPFLRSFPF
jgi:diadenosine tetraphosphate (Ap4A) HIT family hydrolase